MDQLLGSRSDKVTFAYDGESRRISKTVNGEKTSFINDPVAPFSRVLLEKDEQRRTKKRYVYGFSRLLRQGVTDTQFFLYDHPGKSVSLLTDNNQKIIESYRYDAFGVKNEKSALGNFYGYSGEEYDEETGLIYLRNRYYDPEIGRFISPDSVLGILGDPQTLNAYVYVRNNPVNYIDPSGFYAVKVPLYIFGNPPGARTSNGDKSRVGHAWIGGITADKEIFTVGAWPQGKIEPAEWDRSLCSQTVSLKIWITPEQQILARQAANRTHWTPWDNCVDHVLDALDSIRYPHPPRYSFQTPTSGITTPKGFCNWIREERNHIHPDFLPGKDDVCIPYSFDPPQLRFGSQEHGLLFKPNYGGISLSKTAELMTNIADISGVVFDQKTEQVILYGKKDLSISQMHLDDLAVAIRSVYGLGDNPEQDPGVSMDPDLNPMKKKHPGMIVTYYGDTKNTRFGQVLFEADRLLKNLTLGKDNYTGKKFKAHVPGYSNLLKLYHKEYHPSEVVSWRMWFTPEKISLIESEDGSSMVFDQVRMKVLTETTFKKGTYQDSASEKFAAHFTQNYESYAHEFPILQDLKRLGKITGIVKWIKEQGLPFDLSFFKNYIPQFVSTPTDTPKIHDISGGIIIRGGVIYHLDDTNFSTTKSEEVHEVKEEILQARLKEEELIWDFGRGYTAVAQTFAKTLKVGEVKKTFVDMSFPVLGNIPLAFVRTYSSFNEQQSGFGLGWDVTPAKLRFPNEKRWLSFSDGNVLKVYPEIFVGIEAVESLYQLVGLDVEKRPIYRNEKNPALLLENADKTFSFSRKQESLLFDPTGRLIKISDQHGIAIEYDHQDARLVSISHQGKKAIHIEYEGSTITCIRGIGGKSIYYEYTPEGQLKEVRDKEGTLTSYEYDQEQHLSSIFDAKGNKIFEALYDVYHRAEEKALHGIWFKQEFSLSERKARIEGANHFFLEEYFDEKYRPRKMIDALGRKLEWHYAGSFGPEKMIDNDLEISYEYDAFGRPITIKDAYRGERKYAFDELGNLLEEIDGNGTKIAYRYDEKGRLIKIYQPFYMNYLSVQKGKVITRGNESFATSFHYDPLTGSLLSIDFPSGGKQRFILDENGLPLEIYHSNGLVSKRTYDDRLRLIEISEIGKTIYYTYDERDRVTKLASELGEISYSYDRKGNVLSKTDPFGLTSNFVYDENDHLIEVIDAMGNRSFYEYNSFGNLIKIILPNGSVREIQYDEFERPISLK
ncbi:RHS repeat-associated core domain-containing protein [Candidatus Rhabdochlamydia sp. T3358]|uniref:RHS repeat-associated core domain-containing protein n=1 Tax=Candidatus Rhabdochlamydia sp. T3358 TaxID=2099795 RepID=UPI0010B68284|nr:RHS repeat-associated core domain-containing protein [Candidatus Rhabdochlamydia sp. T3358]VHO02131.1 tRNA3(Ser)-specific nuclease WapA precursor [Candidatus Rhabdochlamydia sp. T3358]